MTRSAHDGEDVRLRDGSHATIRSIEPDDKALIAAAFAALSADSRYSRFFTPLETLDERWLAYLTEVDHRDHEALVAIEPHTGAAIGSAPRDLLRAVAAGLLAPARLLAPGGPGGDG